MTPFLGIRLRWSHLRTSLRSIFRSSKDAEVEDSTHQFRQIENNDPERLKYAQNGQTSVVTNAFADADIGRPNSDEIPLQSIAVRQETAWTESRQKT